MQKSLIVLILILLITSCHQQQADNAISGIHEMLAPETRQASNFQAVEKIEKQDIKKKIVKDGRLGLRVSNIESTKLRIDSLIKNNGGYYANENFNNSDWESSYYLQIRIPSTNFEIFISTIEKGKEEILYKEIEARDVTDQFIDLETRLSNKQNYLKRYNDLLKKANSIKEILEIEEKIRALEEEIESTTGRLNYLNNLVDYSTLNLTLSKPKDFKYNPAKRPQFLEQLKLSLSKGWFGFVDFILFIIKLWPLWIFIGLIFYVWKKYKKRKL
jgi:hypothetical protein